jgi:hypothetical protein
MIEVDTSTNTNWDANFEAGLSRLMGRPAAPEALQPKATPARTPRTPKAPKAPATRWQRFTRWTTRTVAPWLNSRARDLALAAIVLAAFVGVFDGARYSATVFSFAGPSIIAFALMPDALMVLAGAKMRQVGITAAQHDAARSAMRFGLAFSLVTNMIAAALRTNPWLLQLTTTVAGHQVHVVASIGAVLYHGVVVMILWHAFETLSKTRSDRKGHKASTVSDPLGALASVATGAVKALGRKASTAKVPAQRAGK